MSAVATKAPTPVQPASSRGLKTYYRNKIEAAEHEITKKTQNLRRLEAQRNTLNTRGGEDVGVADFSPTVA